MENAPLMPRQRNRRADRQPDSPPQTSAVPVQPAAQMQSRPQAMPVQPYKPQAYPYPSAPPNSIPAYSQQMQGQTPMAMYQQPASPAPQPVQQPQYMPRPRVTTSAPTANPTWQQPSYQPRAEVPHARAGRTLSKETARAEKAAQREAEALARKEAREKAEWEAEKARRIAEQAQTAPKKNKLPGWLTTVLSLSIIAVTALIAAYFLMQAYLVTEENKRIAAYEAVLANYHVTEQADGTLTVTWQEYIEKYAAQYNLQPAFVTAIIRNESSFRTGAESSVGARGLMQLMPDTAEWIAGKLDDHSYTADRLWDAETNIRYGCWYLGYLSRLFHGDPVLVSAAYHAGQTTVTQWLSDSTKSADGISLDLDKLSDGPTKQYIGRVTQTYGIYQSLLYPDEAFGPADALPDGSAVPSSAGR